MAKNIYQKLFNIQQELKAPKDSYNAFGKYNYRSCESILEALKPLLAKENCIVVFRDELNETRTAPGEGHRAYVKTTLELIDVESGNSISVTAIAREEKDKKGMDGSQITGASSSYARKYALNALFAIDDNKDSDTTNVGNATPTRQKKAEPVNNRDYKQEVIDYCKTNQIDMAQLARDFKLNHSSTQEDFKLVLSQIKVVQNG